MAILLCWHINYTLADENKGEVIIGIDLGTTYSCVAYVRDGKIEVLPDEFGERTTPSWAAFTSKGSLIGQAAKNQVEDNAKNTVYDSKRLIGRSYKNIKKDLKFYSFDVANNRGKPFIEVDYKSKKQQFSPEEISAMVLSRMKEIAERNLGQKVTKAVITVPAYFNDGQRAATKAAGEIAQLDVVRIINEPTAASMAYGIDKLEGKRTIVVYDLGGGTFDVTILNVDNGVFEVLATNGDTHLGGEDLDRVLVNYFIKLFKKKHKIKIERSNKRARQKLRAALNEAKHVLSTKMQARVEIEDLAGGKGLTETLTRARFEKLVADLLKKTMIPVKNVLDDANLTPDDITEVVLVGGSTRIPYVRKLLKGFFGKKKVNTKVNPDEAVAMGAAVQASILSGTRLNVPGTKRQTGEMVLLDVTPLSLGIKLQGDVMSVIIPRNTGIPTKAAKTYTTVRRNQDTIRIEVYQGESEMAKRNERLGVFDLDQIPSAPAGVPQIEVQFYIDANGILKVTATNVNTKFSRQIHIRQGKGRFSEEQIEKLKERAAKYAEEDKAEKERVSAVMELQKLQEKIDKAAKGSMKKKITAAGRSAVLDALYQTQRWLDYNTEPDIEAIKAQHKSLEKVWAQATGRSKGKKGGEWGDEDDVEADDDDYDHEEL